MALSVKSGSYAGNSTDPHEITGVGFQPKVVIVFASNNTGDEAAAMYKTEDHPVDGSSVTSVMGENGQRTDILSLDADGFTVEGQKNVSGTTYYYVALGGTSVYAGTYTGDGNDNRAITDPGFQPAWVVTQGGSNWCYHKPDALAGDADMAFSVIANNTNGIQSLDATGFTLGNRSTANHNLNQSGVTYYYFCIDSAATNFQTGSYTGNGTDNTNITGVGFDPIAVIVKPNSTAQGMGRAAEAGDLSSFMRTAAPTTNGIQSLITDGFQVGTRAEVNANTTTYYYMAFGATPAATSVKDIIGSGFIPFAR